jgi:hypothetical protein
MIAVTRRIAVAAAAVVALHGAQAVAKDEASFVFTPLEPPHFGGLAYVAGVYQDAAIGYFNPTDAYEGYVWSAGNYTLVPAVGVVNAVSDTGVAVGNTPGSTTSYTTYDVETGATKTFDFGPSGGYKFLIGGINASGTIAATQFTTVMKTKPRTACQPFEQDADGSYNWLAASKLAGLGPVGLMDDGTVVMRQECGEKSSPIYHLSKAGSNKTFTIPGAAYIVVGFVSGTRFGGGYTTTAGQYFGFTSTGVNSSLISYPVPPGSVGIFVTAMGPHHEVAGYAADSATGHLHGFIYSNKTYYTIDYPHYKNTIITGFSSTGAIVGYFGNEKPIYGIPTQPFIATCASDAGCTK